MDIIQKMNSNIQLTQAFNVWYRFNIVNIGMCLLLIILTNSACNKNDSGSPGENEVWMQNTSFKPSSKTISTGTTITWTNKDGFAHTVESNSNLFASGNMKKNDTFQYQFDSTGTFKYHCSIHPASMKGTIEVQ